MYTEFFSHKPLATGKKPVKVTVAKRKAKAQEIIDRNDFTSPFDAFDVEEMNEVLDTECFGFIRKRNTRFPGDPRHLHQIFPDGSTEAISWNKCITPLKPYQELSRVLRDAVRCDTLEFNQLCQPQECAICGCTEMLQTDHVSPSFSEIQRQFTEAYGTPSIEPRSDGVGYQFVNPDDEDRWYLFHADRACYQLLCRSCNASKGAR